MTTISFTEFRKNIRRITRKLRDDRKPMTVTIRGGESFVIMSRKEYEGWKETLYLVSSPANAERLNQAQDDFHNGMRNYHERELIEIDE